MTMCIRLWWPMSATEARLYCARAPLVSRATSSPGVGDVKHDSIRIANITTWKGWILFLHNTTRIDQPAFCSLDVRDQEFKNRSVVTTLFDV
jgi:hypothetical protein